MRFLACLLWLVCAQAHGQEQAGDRPPGESPALPPGRWKWVESTAYCGGPCKMCQTTGKTANGNKTSVVPYNVAADSSLPLGTRIYVPPGYQYLDKVRADDRFFMVDDRGGALESESAERKRDGDQVTMRLDLRFIDHSWAKRWGRRIIAVYVIDPEK
jgi:3D (Asp-Asp-Asp) domain-containing protein